MNLFLIAMDAFAEDEGSRPAAIAADEKPLLPAISNVDNMFPHYVKCDVASTATWAVGYKFRHLPISKEEYI